jgi:hypothetical protein
VNVQRADQPALVGNQQRLDLVLLQHGCGFHGQCIRIDGQWLGRHQSIYHGTGEVLQNFQIAAQVAIGKNAANLLLLIDDGHHAQAFLGHFHNGGADRGTGSDHRDIGASVHDIADAQQQPASQLTTWMGHGKIVTRETMAIVLGLILVLAAVVLAVGARSSGQASRSTSMTTTWSASVASRLWGLPQINTMGICSRFSAGIKLSNSRVLPELENISSRSPLTNMPRSP